MVSLLAIGASAAVNALAFSGTNYIFPKFSDHGEAERKRHDIALEDLLAPFISINEIEINGTNSVWKD